MPTPIFVLGTRSWWRSTAISTSFASEAGPSPIKPRTRRTIKNPSVRTTTTAHHSRADIMPGHGRGGEVVPFTDDTGVGARAVPRSRHVGAGRELSR
jgi:hypothetical protein